MIRSQGVSSPNYGLYIVLSCRLLCITASHREWHARVLRRKTLKVVGQLRVQSASIRHPRGFLTQLPLRVFHDRLSDQDDIHTAMSQQGVHSALGNIPRVVVRPTVDNVVASTYLVKVFEVVLLCLRVC
jgi:hypothetical protein